MNELDFIDEVDIEDDEFALDDFDLPEQLYQHSDFDCSDY